MFTYTSVNGGLLSTSWMGISNPIRRRRIGPRSNKSGAECCKPCPWTRLHANTVSSMRKLLIGLCIWAACGCVRNPVTGKHEIVLVSENEEIALGRQSHDQVRAEYGFVDQ